MKGDVHRLVDRAAVEADRTTWHMAKAGDDQITQALGQAKSGAQTSTQEAESVAAAAAEQLRAIEELTQGASELSALADQLTQAVRFVRGENGRP